MTATALMDGFAVWAGLCFGSFLNVVIHRLPKGGSLWAPRSHCPHCRRLIAFYDNVPVLSFLWLRGRCRRCKAGISWRYPLVEALMGGLAWGLWRRWGHDPLWAFLAVLAAGVLVAVSFIDWDTFLIPDELSLGLLGAGLLASPINPLLAGPSGGCPWWGRVLMAAGGGILGFGICWFTEELGERLFKREGLGGGDFKLLAAVGAWSGAVGAFDCMMVACFLGAAYGVSRMARGTLKKFQPIPFGPFLGAAAIFNFFVLLPFGFPFH